MGTFPSSVFESFRVRAMPRPGLPWRLRLLMAFATLLGLIVFLLLLPVVLFCGLLVAAWIGYVRLRLWLAGLRGGTPIDDDGRENVRVLVRDA